MIIESAIVWFARKKAYYRVPVTPQTEETVWNMEIDQNGYYVASAAEEALLWKYAVAVELETIAHDALRLVS